MKITKLQEYKQVSYRVNSDIKAFEKKGKESKQEVTAVCSEAMPVLQCCK